MCAEIVPTALTLAAMHFNALLAPKGSACVNEQQEHEHM